MPYSSNSSHSPLDAARIGDVTAANIVRVANNPYNPSNSLNWPTKYDAFITKTDDQQSSVSVTDEIHPLTAFSGSNLYLNHRPRLNASITVSGGVVSNVDYNNGVVTFSTLPTGDVTVSYLADPDKYYGEYLTQLQDGLHEVQFWTGTPTGGPANEGVANANFALLGTGGNLANRLPYATDLSALQAGESISIKSDTGVVDNAITLGNGSDQLVVNSDDVDLTQNLTDRVNVTGKLVVATEGVTQSLDQATHSPLAAAYTDLVSDVGVFYGDIVVFGDITTGGNIVSNTSTTNTNVLAQDLQVDGNTILGDSLADTVTISGDTTIAGSLTVSGTVSGTFPGTTSARNKYDRPASSDWTGDSINLTRFTSAAYGPGSATPTTTTVGVFGRFLNNLNVGGNVLTDTTISTFFPETGGLNHTGMYDDGTFRLQMTSSGDIYRVVSVNASSGQWTLDRTPPYVSSAGYEVYNPYTNLPSHLAGSGTTLTLWSTTAKPFVCTIGGYIKKLIGNIVQAGVDVTAGLHWVYLVHDSSGADDDPPQFLITDTGVTPYGAIYIGSYYGDGTGITSVANARPNQKFDSGWVEMSVGANERLRHDFWMKESLFDLNINVLYGGTAATPSSTSFEVPSAFNIILDDLDIGTMGFNVSTQGWYRITMSR